jgi:hypothetical protein
MNMSFADRQKRLRIVQQVHDQWWSEHPEIEPGEAGSDEAEQELLDRINKTIAEAEVRAEGNE